MKNEEEHREKTGWLMTVEFVTASTNTLLKKEKFLMYPKKSTAVDALSMIVGSVVLEVIAINTEASCQSPCDRPNVWWKSRSLRIC
jgi:hypothetical protein